MYEIFKDILLALAEKLIDFIPVPMKTRKYCSPKKERIGLLDSRKVEQYHSYHFIKDNILQEKESVLLIGSPHLKYWFETPDAPRMMDFLDSTKTAKVCVVLYNGNQSNIKSGLDLCQNKYSSRFDYRVVTETSSLSYIYYHFKNKNKIYSRCLVGYQGTEYTDRPFIEFVSPIESECQFVKSIVAAHMKYMERKDAENEDSTN